MFDDWGNCVATFEDVDDCLYKIDFYLTNEKERKQMSRKGHDYVLEHFNYKDIMKKLSDELQYEYCRKFYGSHPLR